MGAAGGDDIEMRSVLWEVIEDVCHSYKVALNAITDADTAEAINTEVLDYIANHYGTDVLSPLAQEAIAECIEQETHLTWTDDDGYCNYCGYSWSEETEEE